MEFPLFDFLLQRIAVGGYFRVYCFTDNAIYFLTTIFVE